jgi:hypothetical protein
VDRTSGDGTRVTVKQKFGAFLDMWGKIPGLVLTVVVAVR